MNRRELQNQSQQVEEVLDEFAQAGDEVTLERAERLVRSVMGLYASGLARVVEVAEERDPALVRALADDEVVGSLLVLHDLHPDDVDTRVRPRWTAFVPTSGRTPAVSNTSASTRRASRI